MRYEQRAKPHVHPRTGTAMGHDVCDGVCTGGPWGAPGAEGLFRKHTHPWTMRGVSLLRLHTGHRFCRARRPGRTGPHGAGKGCGPRLCRAAASAMDGFTLKTSEFGALGPLLARAPWAGGYLMRTGERLIPTRLTWVSLFSPG